jgi:ribonuclease E
MTEPGSQDDGWDELARELGLEKSPSAEKAAPAPDPVSPPEGEFEEEPVAEERPARGRRQRDELAEAADFEDAGLPEIETEALADEAELEQEEGEGGEGEAGEGPGAEGQSGEGPPGTGRKRRRRRRRRKKGAAGAAEPAGEPGAGDEAEEPAPAPAAPARARQVESEEVEADEEGWESEEEPAAVPLAAEEDTGGEVLRELIAGWNVPSWDEIVGGLYRPER